jgi:hypothetical protein
LHVEQGTRLMEHWNMPAVYRAAVDRHSSEHYDPDDTVLVIVRLVNVATRTCGLSLGVAPDRPLMEFSEAAQLGLNEQQVAELGKVLEESRRVSFLSPPA